MTVVDSPEAHRTTVGIRSSPLAERTAQLEAAGVPGPGGVRLREEPFLTQVNLRMQTDDPALPRVEQDLGTTVPRRPGHVGGDADRAVLWLGPDEWLVVAPDGEIESTVRTVRTALADTLGSVVDVSANRTTVRLEGARARETLEKVCALDLHPRAFGPGRCAETLVGRVQVVLWQVTDEPGYRIMVRNSFAGYLADLLMDALSEFGE